MIHRYSYSQLKDAYSSGKLKPTEVVQHYFQNIEKYSHLNNFLMLCKEKAMEQALISDKRYADGTARPLEGMPLGVKDLFCTKDVSTTAASKMLENFVPQYESHVTDLANKAGCVMLGKCNMDEFAMGAANTYSAFGPALNPWHKGDNVACTPGGSSGGSASAVSAYQCLFALGSDTGGSVRQPAAFCGVVGIKPTYGRCSRRGMIAFSSSLDQAGTLARDVTSAAALLQQVMGYDQFDGTSSNKPAQDLLSVTGDVKGLRVGLLKEDNLISDPKIAESLEECRKWLEKNGAIVEETSIAHLEESLSVYYVLTPCEAASNLARYDGVRYGVPGHGETYHEKCMSARSLFGPEVTRRILIGTYFSSSEMHDKYFEQAWRVRKLIAHEFNEAFKKFDVLISPTTPHTSFSLSTPKTPVELYYEDFFTAPANIAGCCAISVPVGLSADKMPIGLQVMAPAFREDLLIKAGLAIEKEANFIPLDTDNILKS